MKFWDSGSYFSHGEKVSSDSLHAGKLNEARALSLLLESDSQSKDTLLF